MDIITTEEVMDKLDMFQYRFGKIEKLAGGISKEFQQMRVRNLPPRISRMNSKPAMLI